jgi:elongation factor G
VVLVDGKSADEKVAAALGRLAEQDPGLAISHDPTTRDLVLSGPGSVHLDIALERLRRVSGLPCRLGPPTIAYRETVTRRAAHVEGKLKKQSGGHGQYAVCVIDLEPLPRGAGFEFVDEIVGGAIPRQFIPSVEKGIQRARERGVLAGFPLEDFRVRLIDGKFHDVDSSDAAFQIAGSKAFKAAALAARPVLLEPVVRITVTVPSAAMGDIMGDLAARRGRILGTGSAEQGLEVSAHVPLSELGDYEPKLKSLTGGLGSFTMSLDHLDICPGPIQERVVSQRTPAHGEDE